MDAGLKLWGILGASAIVLSDDSPTLVKAAARLAKLAFGDRIQICDGTNDEVEIQAAQDIVAGGNVVLVGKDFYIEDDLTIDEGTVSGQGPGGPTMSFSTRLIVSDTKSVIVQRGTIGGRLQNLAVYVYEADPGFQGNAVEVTGNSEYSGILSMLDNVRIYNRSYSLDGIWSGTGLLISAVATGAANKAIARCSFNNLYIEGFEYGLKMLARSSGTNTGYVNGNHIGPLFLETCKYGLVMDVTGGAAVGYVDGNYIVADSETLSGAVNGVQLVGGGSRNIFHLTDWTAPADYSGQAVLLDALSVLNTFTGWVKGVVTNNGGPSNRIELFYGDRCIVSVHPAHGDYDKLSDALTAITDAAADKRYCIQVHGHITDDGIINFKDYVDVVGFGAIVESTIANGDSMRIANKSDILIRDITLKKTGVASGTGDVLVVYSTTGVVTDGVRLENVELLNETTGNGAQYGLYMHGEVYSVFRNCRFVGGTIGNDCYGAYVGAGYSAANPRFYNCKAEHRSNGTGPAWILLKGAPYLKDCIAKCGDASNGNMGFQIHTNCNAELVDCKTELYQTHDVWDYDDLNNGRFQPYAGHPYQLIHVTVRVVVANIGVTLDLGTSIGGTEIATGIAIGTTGSKTFAFTRVEVAAAGYLYATPSGAIDDDDIQVWFTVVKNYDTCRPLYINCQHFARIIGGSFIANGASDACYIALATPLNWQISGAHLETLDPVNQYSVNAVSAIAAAPIRKCSFIGALNNITTRAPDDGYLEFTVNAFQYPAPGTDWTPQLEGAGLPASKTTKKCWLPLNFLKEGDEIISYKVTGDVVEAAAATLDCKLVRVNLADPLTTTDVAGGAISQVAADGDFDSLATLTNPEVVATDKQYALEVLGTTGIGDAITVMGAEVKIARVG